ncbi:nucleotidyltransferase family protein [Nocardia alni]|uniref:nucleotidyltransferase family protein n=1 Tax=Nocardia alni TaxID=2815723 RepID=UPI001C23C362|nr:nucleotidyltransferase family protein [Nocardia alni]
MTAVTAVVLAAGSSRRLGSPKQLLPYRNTTLLGATLAAVRRCGLPQNIVTLGGAARSVRESVDLTGFEVVQVEEFGAGCAASLRAALPAVRPDAAGIVLALGDQPELPVRTVRALLDVRDRAPIVVCHYRDGDGHPFWLRRSVFADLAALHGDKAVWKLVESGRVEVGRLEIDARVPLDVDTWEDYRRLLAAESA